MVNYSQLLKLEMCFVFRLISGDEERETDRDNKLMKEKEKLPIPENINKKWPSDVKWCDSNWLILFGAERQSERCCSSFSDLRAWPIKQSNRWNKEQKKTWLQMYSTRSIKSKMLMNRKTNVKRFFRLAKPQTHHLLQSVQCNCFLRHKRSIHSCSKTKNLWVPRNANLERNETKWKFCWSELSIFDFGSGC